MTSLHVWRCLHLSPSQRVRRLFLWIKHGKHGQLPRISRRLPNSACRQLRECPCTETPTPQTVSVSSFPLPCLLGLSTAPPSPNFPGNVVDCHGNRSRPGKGNNPARENSHHDAKRAGFAVCWFHGRSILRACSLFRSGRHRLAVFNPFREDNRDPRIRLA